MALIGTDKKGLGPSQLLNCRRQLAIGCPGLVEKIYENALVIVRSMRPPQSSLLTQFFFSVFVISASFAFAEDVDRDSKNPTSVPLFSHPVDDDSHSTFAQAELRVEPMTMTVTIETGELPRINAPASVELSTPKNGDAIERHAAVRLVEISGDKERTVRCQLEMSNPARLWWIVDGTTPPHTKRTYRIHSTVPNKPDDELETQVRVDRKPDFVEFHISSSRVLRYNSSHIEVTEKVDPIYGRSAYIHPAWTPKGSIVTDQFPPDHAHQSGIFLANVKTEFEGRTPDFWNLAGKTGRVRFKELKSIVQGPVFGELTVDHEHVDLSAESEKVAINETWSIRVWNLNETNPTFWVCDITSTMTRASASPLRIKQYHYGGMALRGAREWKPENCRCLTSEGHDRLAGNHTRPRWCDMSGDVDNRLAGITLMTQANNFAFPEPLRIHPTMPYMVYTPAVLGDRDLVPDKPLIARYRFLFHDGEIPAETADRLANDFNDPLIAKTVTITRGGG